MVKRNVLGYVYRPTVVVVTLFLIMFIVIFAQFLVTQLIWLYTYEKPSPPQFPDDPQWRVQKAEKLFLPDGTLHLVRGMAMQNHGDYGKEEITDVNGKVLWDGIRKDRPFKYLDWGALPREFAEFYGEQEAGCIGRWLLSPQLPGILEVPVSVAGEVKDVWRYNFEAETFAGYEVGGGPIGYLGANGFAGLKAEAQPLGEIKGFASWTDEDPSAVVMFWQTKRRIYQIDFCSKTVETIFDSKQSDIESILWHQWRATNPRDRDDSGIQYRPLIYCKTADHKHHLIMREPNQVLTVEIPEQWGWGYDVDFTATSEDVFLRYYDKNFTPPASWKLTEGYQREYDSKPQPHSFQLYKVAENGKLELVNRFDWTRPVPIKSNTSYPQEITLKCIRRTSPPAFDLLTILFGDDLYDIGHKPEGMSMMVAYARIITQLRPRYSALNYSFSAVMMCFALWHGWARRTSWGKLILWLVIVGAFNLAGLLTYLALNHTPIIKCPVCGKKRGLERLNCIRCGNPLPIPQRRPTDLVCEFKT